MALPVQPRRLQTAAERALEDAEARHSQVRQMLALGDKRATEAKLVEAKAALDLALAQVEVEAWDVSHAAPAPPVAVTRPPVPAPTRAPENDRPAMRRDEAARLARRDPDSLSDGERAQLDRYLRDGVVGADDSPDRKRPGVRLPLAARILRDPERTTYGRMWETDLDAIERKPFNDRPWLTRTAAVIAKFRPRDLRDELRAASLTTLAATMARLWYEGKSVCHHSWSYIAERSGLCRDTVRLGLAWLRLHGLMVGMNVLVRPEGPAGTETPSGAAEERVANVYFPKLPEEGPPELALPIPESVAAKANVIERVKAEINYIARFCRDAVVTAWGINIRRAPARNRGHPAPA